MAEMRNEPKCFLEKMKEKERFDAIVLGYSLSHCLYFVFVAPSEKNDYHF
jgi:hypothetical protein